MSKILLKDTLHIYAVTHKYLDLTVFEIFWTNKINKEHALNAIHKSHKQHVVIHTYGWLLGKRVVHIVCLLIHSDRIVYCTFACAITWEIQNIKNSYIAI